MEQPTQPAAGVGVRKERRIESLGWLTESSVMPKKQRVIEGVGAGSIVELRAQLYQTQEDVRRMREGDLSVPKHRARKKNDVFARKNPGVEARETRDKLIVKGETDGTASYAALEKKAALYEKLARGELPDEEDKEKYSVDFLRKGFLEDEAQEMERERTGEAPDERIQDGNSEPQNSDYLSTGWTKAGSSASYKELVRDVNRETLEAREKATLLKQRRQNVAERQREKLRQAFLKKQLGKLKSNAAQNETEHLQPSATSEV